MDMRCLAIAVLYLPLAASAQTSKVFVSGNSRFELREDSTFSIYTSDPVYSFSYEYYSSEGTWTQAGERIILNPGKTPRPTSIRLEENTVPGDSITIRIDYQVETWNDEQFVSREKMYMENMTVYLNHRRNYRNLRHYPYFRVCSFGRRVGRQYIVDSTVTVRFAKKEINHIGFYTYGMERYVKLIPENSSSNNFVIHIIQPVDTDRRPRSYEILIKKNKLFYFHYEGELVTGGLLAYPWMAESAKNQWRPSMQLNEIGEKP